MLVMFKHFITLSANADSTPVESKFTFEDVLQIIWEWLTNTGVKILVSIVFIIIAFIVIKLISRSIEKRFKKNKKVDKTISRTVLHATTIILKVLVILAVIGYLGIDTSGITALIASLGVGVGLAVNGALSNFAGGFLLLVTRPFKVDDYVSALGYEGTVIEIRMINTLLKTTDGKIVYLPNSQLSSNSIVNYSSEKNRRVDVTFGISYDSDIDDAKAVLKALCDQNELILKEPAVSINVTEQADSSINITVKAWTLNANYWDVKFYLIEGAKKAFDEKGIEIPYNQLDVRIKNN